MRIVLPSMLTAILVLLSYVAGARYLALQQVNEIAATIENSEQKNSILNAVDGLSYPVFVMALVILSITYFGYQAFLFWNKQIKMLNTELTIRNAELQQLATIDSLSQVYNRRHLLELADQEFARAQRGDGQISILMVDADYFKTINDTYGHLAGDDVIRALAKRITRCLREYDVLGRYGGEEFIVMLPDTDLEQARLAGERFRRAVQESPLSISVGDISVTVSIGVATIDRSDSHYTDIVERADRALYKAKEAGRNRVELDQTMVNGELGLKASEILRVIND